MIRLVSNEVKKSKNTIRVDKMTPGQIGRAVLAPSKLIIAYYDGAMDLLNPGCTWAFPCSIEVTLLDPNEIVTVEYSNE